MQERARVPKRSVESVSATCSVDREQFITSAVTELPPRESCSTRVSFELRYGTCTSAPERPFEPAGRLHSARRLITSASVDRDWLIVFASSKMSELAALLPGRHVFFTHSLPARSTRQSFAEGAAGEASGSCGSKRSMKMLCERELLSFMPVAAVARLLAPWKKASRAWPQEVACTSRRPRTTTPWCLSSPIDSSASLSGSSRSRSRSM
mmetsp:Transcript_60278/g.155223  ORF Transcript_60278/g.155223 Transcript_60278/m.155223 type:complete len:209 (+) Transcript_60278:393-1019(+)